MLEDFAIFILSHGRADNVVTYRTLQRAGYTGRVYIVIDNEDKQAERYYENFGDKVIMFDKAAEAERTDCGDNFEKRNTVLFARNAVFDIADKLQVKCFLVLDDDYTAFDYRFDNNYKCGYWRIKDLDSIIKLMIDYIKSTELLSIAFLQHGDMLGGVFGGYSKKIRTYRKAMNSFFCLTERRFDFIARMNDDVTTYVKIGNLGKVFLSINNCVINQKTTQQSSGGLTEMYLDFGTYVKSFYTVMYQPSSVKVSVLKSNHKRLHHEIDWSKTVPCILPESFRKKSRSRLIAPSGETC